MTTPAAPALVLRREPLEAFKALLRLARDPDDTSLVFDIVRALEGPELTRNYARFLASPLGRARPPSLAATLADRGALRAMPEGSLGRAYLAFAERNGIQAEGLVAASQPEGYARLEDPGLRAFAERLRDQHDLWHVVTGYGPDVVGELSLLAFTFAQTRTTGIGAILGAGLFLTLPFVRRGGAARATILEGGRRGREAVWLPAAPWEELLEKPLDAVRLRLRIGPPPRYRAVFTEDLRFTRAHATA